MANDKSDSSKDNDIEKLRVSDRQIDNNLRNLAADSFKTKEDKDGQERFWGFKVSKTAAFAINSLYDNVIYPWTREGAKHVYQAALKLAERSEHTSGKAHEIASAVALAARITAVVAKPAAEFISINREHFNERNELAEDVRNAISGTPADYSSNEVIMTAFDRVHNNWSRDAMRKIPDVIKTGIQASMAYTEHQDDMSKKPGAFKAPTVKTPTGATVDQEKDDFFKRIEEMEKSGKPKAAIEYEVEEFRRKRGFVNTDDGKQASLGILNPNASGLLGVGTEFVKVMVDEYAAPDKSRKENAWEKIKLLKRYMDEQPAGQSPDKIKINGTSLKKFIVDIFQQNEIDRGRGRMGEALVEQLMPAVDKIAKHLADTTMDANGLVHLVGDHKVIIHQGSARIFAKEESVEEAIEKLRGVNTSKEKVNTQEFFSNFADPMLARDVIKKNALELPAKEKAVFAAVFPDELLTQAGLGKEAIEKLRKDAHSTLYDVVAANTMEMAQQTPDELKETGLSKSEIRAITELANEIKHGHLEAVKVAVDGSERTVVSAIRTAALHQQIENKGDAAEKVWTDMIQKGASFREKLESTEAARTEQPKSFTDRVKKPAEQHEDKSHASQVKGNPNHHGEEHSHTSHVKKEHETHGMTAAEKELHHRSKHSGEAHEGVSAGR